MTDKSRKLLTSILSKIGLLAGLLFIVFGLIGGFARVKTSNMEPELHFRDIVFYQKQLSDLAINDLAIYSRDGTEYVSRIIALPGDTIKIDDLGLVYRNGILVYEGYVFINNNYCIPCEYTLSEDQYFVLNDNRTTEGDSRTLGPIATSEIKGSIVLDISRYGI